MPSLPVWYVLYSYLCSSEKNNHWLLLKEAFRWLRGVNNSDTFQKWNRRTNPNLENHIENKRRRWKIGKMESPSHWIGVNINGLIKILKGIYNWWKRQLKLKRVSNDWALRTRQKQQQQQQPIVVLAALQYQQGAKRLIPSNCFLWASLFIS